MRKLLRNMMRNEARKNGVKPSTYVNKLWDKLQVKRYGYDIRELCKKVGTGKGGRRRVVARNLSVWFARHRRGIV